MPRCGISCPHPQITGQVNHLLGPRRGAPVGEGLNHRLHMSLWLLGLSSVLEELGTNASCILGADTEAPLPRPRLHSAGLHEHLTAALLALLSPSLCRCGVAVAGQGLAGWCLLLRCLRGMGGWTVCASRLNVAGCGVGPVSRSSGFFKRTQKLIFLFLLKKIFIIIFI